MAFRKVTVPSPEDPKQMVDAYEIPVEASDERWSDIRLADGAVFKVKVNVVQVARLIGRTDASGKPVYVMNAQPAVAVVTMGEDAAKDSSV